MDFYDFTVRIHSNGLAVFSFFSRSLHVLSPMFSVQMRSLVTIRTSVAGWPNDDEAKYDLRHDANIIHTIADVQFSNYL